MRSSNLQCLLASGAACVFFLPACGGKYDPTGTDAIVRTGETTRRGPTPEPADPTPGAGGALFATGGSGNGSGGSIALPGLEVTIFEICANALLCADISTSSPSFDTEMSQCQQDLESFVLDAQKSAKDYMLCEKNLNEYWRCLTIQTGCFEDADEQCDQELLLAERYCFQDY